MKITNLQINNFQSIGSMNLNLADKGLVFIKGDNQYDSSAGSNGAGKSSIVSAILWCLFGVTDRGLSNDAVVNTKFGKNCFVSISLEESDGLVFQVIRYRKHKEFKNKVVVYINSEEATKGNNNLTQDFITESLGCDKDSFLAGVYASQEDMIDIPRLTDKSLKELIEKSCNYESLERAYSLARSKRSDSQTALNFVEMEISDGYRRKVQLEERILAAEQKYIDWSDNRGKVIAKLDTEMAETEASLETLKEEFSAIKFDDDYYQSVWLKFANYQDEMIEWEVELERLKKKLHQLTVEKVSIESEKAKKVEELKDKEANLYADKNCPECGQKLSNQEAWIESVSDKCKKIRAMIKSLEDIEMTIYGEIGDVNVKILQYEATKPDHGAIVREFEAISSKKTDYENKRQSVLDAENHIKFVDQSKDRLLASSDEPTVDKELYEELSGIKAKLLEFDAKRSRALEESELLEAVEQVYSRSGVRAFILDSVTPQLNISTNEYLSALSDGNLIAEWNTLTEDSSGKQKERFSVSVSSSTGTSSYSSLSGGEKKKVHTACYLALQDLIASRSYRKFDLFIADEIDSAVDNDGLERLMVLLEGKAKEKGTVLVISHADLKDWIRETATVVKSPDGISYMEGIINA